MRKAFLLHFLIIWASITYAQDTKSPPPPKSAKLDIPNEPPYSSGLLFDDEEYNKTPMQSKFAGSKFAELPVKVSLRKYCPIPGNQGNVGSCVGWSTCYAGMTTQYAIVHKMTDKKLITEHAYSGLFLYNMLKASEPSCKGGTRLPIAMEKLHKTGTCLNTEFVHSDCSILPPDDLKEAAKKNAITDYMSLFSTTDSANVRIRKTKECLAENKPVVVGMSLMYNFPNIKKSDPYWHPEQGEPYPIMGHALCVIGYDDGKDAFEIMNSWGTAWGDSGFCYIKYADYAKYTRYGFEMFLSPDKADTTKSKLGGEFVFQTLKDRNTLRFEPVSPKLVVGGYYTLEKRDWKIGDLFQLTAKNSHSDEYVYVFSMDSKRAIHIHFPRTENLSADYEGFNETPLVPVANSEIIIPSPESALSIAAAGTDYLFVLFSKTRIDNLKDIIAKVKVADDATIFTELRKAIGTRLPALKDVKYGNDKMNFFSNATPDSIVPLVLAVESK